MATSQFELARSAAVLVTSRIATMLCAWLAEVLLVRLLVPEQWETLSRYLTVVAVLSTAGQLGIPDSLLVFAARSPHRRERTRLLLRSLAWLFMVGVVFGSALVAFSGALEQALAVSLAGSAPWLLAAWIVAELGWSAFVPYLVGGRRVRLAGLLATLGRLPPGLGLVAAAWLAGTPEQLLLGAASGAFASLLMGVVLVLPSRSEATGEGLPVSVSEHAKFVLLLGSSRLIGILNAHLDKLLVMGLVAQAVHGVYYLGAFELPLAAILCSAVTSVILPHAIACWQRGERDAFVALWHVSMRSTALVVYPALCFAFAFAEPLFATIYGDAYLDAVVPFRIFQLLLVHRITNYGLILQAVGNARAVLAASLVMLSVHAVLGPVLARQLGFVGPAIAAAFSVCVSSLVTFQALRRSLALSWPRLLPWAFLARTLLVSTVSLVPAWLVTPAQPGPVATLLALLVYVGTYAGVASWFGVLTRNDWYFVRELVTLRFFASSHRGDGA